MTKESDTFQMYNIQTLSNFITERLSWLNDNEFFDLQCSDNGESEAIEIVENNLDIAKCRMNAQQVWYGASKCVFYFEEYPKVVFKIPFRGEGHFYFDEISEEYVYNTFDIAEYFEGASLASEPWDYCEQEQKVYELAEEAGLNYFLAKTFKLCTYNGHPIYVSQYAEDVDNIKECSEGSRKIARDYVERENDYAFSYSALGNFLDQYDNDAVYRLLSFFRTHNLRDFHCGNLGYSHDGKLIIVDYSDFNS